jgi:CheY-like chemotaxis protein
MAHLLLYSKFKVNRQRFERVKYMKILVVDDNRQIILITTAMLERERHHVWSADNSSDGYAKFLDTDPDLIITDIQMPSKNGFELMEEIRSHNPDIKTIYMSGNIDLFHRKLEHEKQHYQTHMLPKPFRRSDLIQKISELSN